MFYFTRFFLLRRTCFFKGTYEKQMRILTSDNEKLKQHFHQTERTITQLKKENEDLQLKVKSPTMSQFIFAVEFRVDRKPKRDSTFSCL